MVTIYNLIDFVLFLGIVYFIYYSYKHKSYVKIFEYFKIFLAITLSAKLASTTAILLQKLYITKADTYTTLILIAFVLNLILFYFGGKYLFLFSKKYINNEKIKTALAKIFTLIEVLAITTFSLYMVMQLYIAKVYLYPTIEKTFFYPKIEQFYHSFLNDDFIHMILGADTGTNRKEVIFKSFKNSF